MTRFFSFLSLTRRRNLEERLIKRYGKRPNPKKFKFGKHSNATVELDWVYEGSLKRHFVVVFFSTSMLSLNVRHFENTPVRHTAQAACREAMEGGRLPECDGRVRLMTDGLLEGFRKRLP